MGKEEQNKPEKIAGFGISSEADLVKNDPKVFGYLCFSDKSVIGFGVVKGLIWRAFILYTARHFAAICPHDHWAKTEARDCGISMAVEMAPGSAQFHYFPQERTFEELNEAGDWACP